MSIPSTTWWLSRNIPPRSSKIPGTGCPGIIRPAYPSTIPDDPAPPNILNQRCAACCAKTGRHGERLPPSLTPGKFFLATQAYRKHTNEWKECKIADAPFEIIDGDRGTNYPKQDEFNQNGYCLFLNAKNVTTDGFAFNAGYFISKEKDKILRKGKLQRNDIILT